MNRTQGRSRGFYALLLGAMVALSCSGLQAQSRQELEEAQARFKQEMADCVSGHTSQDKDSCMREARSALAEVKRGVPDRPGKLEADTRQRCEVHQGEQRDACEARMRDAGSATGSVKGGEISTPIPTP